MAQTAKPAAEKAFDYAKKAADDVVEQGERTADRAADVTREAADRAEDVARHGLQIVQRTVDAVSNVRREVAHRSADGTAELGRVLVDLTVEQTQQNLEALSALTRAIDWDRVAQAVDWDRLVQIQSEYLRVSLELGAQLTRRYLELGQAVLNVSATAAERQARKAA
jgi:hypothetical protein